MATPPFDFDPTKPADNDIVSQFPANERAHRDNVQDSFATEHDEASGHHKIGVGGNSARDTITDWVIGSIWINTQSSTTKLQRVVSLGPVVWEDLGTLKALSQDDFGNSQIAYKNSAGTFGFLTVPASTFVGRKATGEISAMTKSEVLTLLNLVDGTAGQLISFNASNLATAIAAGTVGQILKSQGGTAPPLFADGGNSYQLFTVSGTFTRPPGITKILALLIAAGGGGGNSENQGFYGGGGAGGEALLVEVSITDDLTVTIGVGGNGGTGTGGQPGTAGGDTILGNVADADGVVATAKGGAGGPGNTTGNPAVGGNGGTTTGTKVLQIAGGGGGPRGVFGTNNGTGGASGLNKLIPEPQGVNVTGKGGDGTDQPVDAMLIGHGGRRGNPYDAEDGVRFGDGGGGGNRQNGYRGIGGDGANGAILIIW